MTDDDAPPKAEDQAFARSVTDGGDREPPSADGEYFGDSGEETPHPGYGSPPPNPPVDLFVCSECGYSVHVYLSRSKWDVNGMSLVAACNCSEMAIEEIYDDASRFFPREWSE